MNTLIKGNATFKSNDVQAKLFRQKILSILQQKSWWLQQEVYDTQNWKLIFQKMVQCRADIVYLYETKNSTIIKEICHVNFINLAQLELYQNNINNIQALSLMNCSNLTVIFLNDNKISTIKSLSKINLNRLTFLSLCDNPITQITCFTSMNVNPQKIGQIYLQWFDDHFLIGQDFSIFFKLNSSNLSLICARSNKRIKQNNNKIQLMLKNKHPSNLIITKQIEEEW